MSDYVESDMCIIPRRKQQDNLRDVDDGKCGGNIALSLIPPLHTLAEALKLMEDFKKKYPLNPAVKRKPKPLHQGQKFDSTRYGIVRRIGPGVRLYSYELWVESQRRPEGPWKNLPYATIDFVSDDLRKASVNVGTEENPIHCTNTVEIWKHWNKVLHGDHIAFLKEKHVNAHGSDVRFNRGYDTLLVVYDYTETRPKNVIQWLQMWPSFLRHPASLSKAPAGFNQDPIRNSKPTTNYRIVGKYKGKKNRLYDDDGYPYWDPFEDDDDDYDEYYHGQGSEITLRRPTFKFSKNPFKGEKKKMLTGSTPVLKLNMKTIMGQREAYSKNPAIPVYPQVPLVQIPKPQQSAPPPPENLSTIELRDMAIRHLYNMSHLNLTDLLKKIDTIMFPTNPVPITEEIGTTLSEMSISATTSEVVHE